MQFINTHSIILLLIPFQLASGGISCFKSESQESDINGESPLNLEDMNYFILDNMDIGGNFAFHCYTYK